MSYKEHVTAIEIVDDTEELVCKIRTFDECCAAVEIDTIFTAESWKELADKVYENLLVMGM